ncbi:MAG TPA: hypothetical protein VHP33_26120 [Polyangiaceae bacterium]|nr:hypothetical protein [Polyangiaceae bacterium]
MLGCRSPTQAHLDLRTDALCVDVLATSLTAGTLASIESAEPVTVTKACATGHIGDLFVIPSGERDEPFAVRVVAGLNKSPEDCVRDGYVGGCIVARRSLRFIRNETLELPIALEVICRDVPCEATQTCRRGKCVSASIDDPSQCVSSGGCDVSAAGADAGGSAGSGSAGSGGASAGGVGAGSAGVGAGGVGGSDAGGTAGEGGTAATAGAGTEGGSGGSGGGGGNGGATGGQSPGGAAGAPATVPCGPVSCSAPMTCCSDVLGTCSLPGGACPF